MFADSSKSTFGAHMDVAAESSRLPTPLFQHVNEILKYYLFRKRQFGSSLVLSFCVCPGQGLKVFKKTSKFLSPQIEDFTPNRQCWNSLPNWSFHHLSQSSWHPVLSSPATFFWGVLPTLQAPTRPPLATPGWAEKFARGNFHLPPRESQPTGPPLLQLPWRCDVKCKNRRN